MTWLREVPVQLRWTVVLGAVGLALAVPFSAPDGTGMQWDELVLGSVAASCAVMVFRRLRVMERAAARPWWPPAVGAVGFAVAQFLAGSFPGPEFDGFGVDDVILLLGATSPLVTCAVQAWRVIRTRWSALAVDGAVVVVAILVITEVLRTPLVNPANAPEDLRSLVLTYGAYAAVMLGGAGVMCTVSTAAMRRSATTLLVGVALQASAAGAEAMAIVSPSWVWTAASDSAVAAALLCATLAAHRAPLHSVERTARASAPQISPAGLVLVVAAVLGMPLALGVGVLQGEPLSTAAELGIAVVLLLVGLRLVLRIREDSRVTEDLVRSEEDFRELIESSSDGIAIIDAQFRLLFTSPAARDLLGIDGATARDVSLLDLVVPEDRDAVRAGTRAQAAGDGSALHFRVPVDGAEPRELEVTSSERPGGSRRVLYLRDVTSRRLRERELERMAYTDHLTGLPNRVLLFRELGVVSDDPRALLVLDLDGFKAVNDVAGHEAGDQLLVEVARRLHTVVRDDDLVARLGGDEFAVLLSGSVADGEEVAHRVVDVMARPFRAGGQTFAVGASVGVSTLATVGGQAAFRAADAALREAKRAGKGCVRLAETDALVVSGMEDLSFAAALAQGTLSLRMDTACNAEGGIDLVHATPVYEHPVRGVVRGLELWSVADRFGRIPDLQRWLLRQACAGIALLDEPSLGVAVSLPPGAANAEGLANEVAAAVADAGIEPSRLVLSFTEETLMTSSAALVPELEAVRRTGVRLCLDGYGMGHSIWALLARVPLDLVRVELSSLATRDDTDRALTVLASIARTTEALGLRSIAGGIATAEQRDGAIAAGIHLLHGRALPYDLTVEDLASQLAAGHAVPR
ncbi:diguanylate cyclase [Blastococcus sp. TF02A_35]|uniref:diguanylate cyclase domain-containing protein n=1 Tax=Blastococcus sp. TF02A-35 TaxID=2559612 RepID=UPI001073D212|nr:diguanylate cyclase [Blastococcus sp. TF02A_35]TFV53732.1 diguanylate cyclase [Blastococcus sp. TF02A_35]